MEDESSTAGQPVASEGSSTISDGQESRREPIPAPKPSQAEGDRETVEHDLQEREED